ncbi:MAG: helix-turn-helix transcriptional regulator [Clostridia bacterium]|nr:helix-turn-helix transcriptional regulator [Clostridia bacterium]
MTLSADILRGYTDAIILMQLQNGDSYGYRISREVSRISEGGLEMKEATLYTAFRRLEGAGMISSYWGDEMSGARRRYYTITELGREKLRLDRENWQQTKLTLDKLIGGQ